MPPAAAMGAGIAASGIGSIFSAKAGQPKNVPTTAPTPLFPFLNGQYGQQLSGAGKAGLEGLQETARTGNPVDIGDAFSKMLDAQQKTLGMGRAGLREQFGSQGLMGSSSFRDAAVNYEGQADKDFMSTFSQMMLTANENAKNRQLDAQKTLGGMFGDAATSYTPSSTLVSGAPSSTGSALGSMGNLLTLLGYLKKK